MNRDLAKLVVLFCLFGAPTVFADDARKATLPATEDLAVLERSPPSERRNLVTVRLTLPKLDDRTPLSAEIVVVENGREVAVREMVRTGGQAENVILFARACNPAAIVTESVVRLRERDHLTGKIRTIDLPLVEAMEVENPKPANPK